MTLTNHAKRGSPVRVNPFVGNFPCPLSPTGYCKHGGNKAFNYGVMRGTSSYCRKAKKWVHDMDVCPIANDKHDGRL